MVDDAEWSRVWAAYGSGGPRGLLDEYERLTGFRETDLYAVLHHRIALYGPPCPRCDTALRTPVAYKCFECAHVLRTVKESGGREGLASPVVNRPAGE